MNPQMDADGRRWTQMDADDVGAVPCACPQMDADDFNFQFPIHIRYHPQVAGQALYRIEALDFSGF